MDLLHASVLAAAFLCSLVAGFLFAFAAVAMPGIEALEDRAFLRAFGVMDRVIQNNQPAFVLVWVGSVLAVLAAVVLGVGRLEGAALVLLGSATLVYLGGVQLPTLLVNIPLNNRLQALDLDALDAAACHMARQGFEARWNRWNRARTVLAGLAAALLLALVYQL